MWSSCSLDWKHGRSLYRIAIQNPERQHHGVQSAMLDGVEVEPQAIPLHDDGRTHDVVIVLGSVTTSR